VNLPEEAANDMLEKSDSLLLNKLRHHVTENGANGVETLVSLADVGKTSVIQKDLLYNEDGHGLAQLRSRLHDPEAEWNNLSSEQEVDNFS
jgi:hypothetical protein